MTIDKWKKLLDNTLKKHKVELLLGMFFLTALVGVVCAVVYNSMYMQSNIGCGT
jgi:hypothetical protein